MGSLSFCGDPLFGRTFPGAMGRRGSITLSHAMARTLDILWKPHALVGRHKNSPWTLSTIDSRSVPLRNDLRIPYPLRLCHGVHDQGDQALRIRPEHPRRARAMAREVTP